MLKEWKYEGDGYFIYLKYVEYLEWGEENGEE